MKQITDTQLPRPDRRTKKQQLELDTSGTNCDMLRLMQELQLHQIELEMQNDELRLARTESDIALHKYTGLYDFAPIGYITLGHDGVILQLNLACAKLIGIERKNLLGRRLPVLHDYQCYRRRRLQRYGYRLAARKIRERSQNRLAGHVRADGTIWQNVILRNGEMSCH